jgi:glycosyltransferase involved in cell wall biosynthesis
LRILQFIDVPWDSGLAHYALALSEGLKMQGHQVYVSAIPGQKPWQKAKGLDLKTVPLARLTGLNPLRRFLKAHGIQVLNPHTGSTQSLAVASALGQRVAVVRTRSDARGVRARVGSHFLFNHTQRVIAAADYIRNAYLKALHLPSKKVVTIYQGLAVSDFEVRPFPTVPTVGMVARLDPVKGHRYLLEAVSLLKNIYPVLRVRLFGQEENIKQSDLRTIAEHLHIESMVEFMGYQRSVPEAMASCTIGVIASAGSEAVSRVALEWMAAGRPVVATQVGCLPEIVQDAQTGYLVPPRDAPAMARALAGLLHNPGIVESMGKAGRLRVETEFGMDRFINQTLSVYKEAMKEAHCFN